MNLKTVPDQVNFRDFLIVLNELYKIPSDFNLLTPSYKQLVKK